MDYLTAVFLGAIQGVTEFLPISSSGHLVVFQQIFGVSLHDEALLTFDIALHFGTLIAVVAVFYRDIGMIVRDVVRWAGTVPNKNGDSPLGAKLGLWIIIGTIPAAVLGILFEESLEHLFSSVTAVGWMWLITGTFLWVTRYCNHSRISANRMNFGQTILIGLAQALAVIPGISRSGATIATGLFLKLDRELAAKFSFLLAIPAIAGGMVLKLKVLSQFQMQDLGATIAGMLAAVVVGYIALRFLVGLVKRGKLFWFAFYCWAAGIIALIFSRIH